MKRITLFTMILALTFTTYSFASANEISSPQFANTKAVNLSDTSNHWGKANIENLVARGGIVGYPDGTFKPNNNITVAEFLKIAVKSPLEGKIAENTGGHWATSVFNAAKENGILLEYDLPQSEWNRPITRYEMAYILVRVTEKIMSEEKVEAANVANIMSDYAEVSKEGKYKYYVEQAFMKGLLTGKTSDGLYDGKANGTRAEAATMVVRMLEQTKREQVNTNKETGGRDIAVKAFNAIPEYNTNTRNGLIFDGTIYTFDDAAVFAYSYLSVRTNYDGTDKTAMGVWEKQLNQYVVTADYVNMKTMKNNILKRQGKAESDVFVDPAKVERKNGKFLVHGVVYNKTDGTTWKVEVQIAGHDVNKSEIGIDFEKWTEVK